MVETSFSNAGDVGWIPGWGAKIPHVSRPKTQNLKQSSTATNSIKTQKKNKQKKTQTKPEESILGSVDTYKGGVKIQDILQKDK